MKKFEKTVYLSHKYGGDKNNLKEVEEIIKTQKSVFTLTKKKEFAELLINNYIQSNLTDLHEGAKKNYRNIYVIKNSTILTNLKVINGIVAQIPLPKSLEKYTPHQRQTILKNFLLFCGPPFNISISSGLVRNVVGNLKFFKPPTGLSFLSNIA